MLNNNVLSNSDFLTGAFPAEYGNTLSGVFDLRMRNGNSQNHEFLIQTGVMGLEAGAEGPISKHNNSSYLINCRYSTIGILDHIGISPMGTAQSHYQDVASTGTMLLIYWAEKNLFSEQNREVTLTSSFLTQN